MTETTPAPQGNGGGRVTHAPVRRAQPFGLGQQAVNAGHSIITFMGMFFVAAIAFGAWYELQDPSHCVLLCEGG